MTAPDTFAYKKRRDLFGTVRCIFRGGQTYFRDRYPTKVSNSGAWLRGTSVRRSLARSAAEYSAGNGEHGKACNRLQSPILFLEAAAKSVDSTIICRRLKYFARHGRA